MISTTLTHPARTTLKLTADPVLVAATFQEVAHGVRVTRTFANLVGGERVEETDSEVARRTDAHFTYTYLRRIFR